jgi:hypothetical protein
VPLTVARSGVGLADGDGSLHADKTAAAAAAATSFVVDAAGLIHVGTESTLRD